MLKDFLRNDAQHNTLRKGFWSRVADRFYGVHDYILAPTEESNEAASRAKPPKGFLGRLSDWIYREGIYRDEEVQLTDAAPKKEVPLYLAWVKPILRPIEKIEGYVRLRRGGLFLTLTSGLGEAIIFLLDYVISAVAESIPALIGWARYDVKDPAKREPLKEHKKSSLFGVAIKRLLNLFFLVPVFKWLWRTCAITLPAWGLEKNRLFFLAALFVVACIFIAATLFSGGLPGAVAGVFLLGHSSTVLPFLASALSSVNAFCGGVGAWMGANWFALLVGSKVGAALSVVMVPLIQNVLFASFVAAVVSMVSNLFAAFGFGCNKVLDRCTGGKWNKSIDNVEAVLDRALFNRLDIEPYKPRPTALKTISAKGQGPRVSEPGSPVSPDARDGVIFDNVGEGVEGVFNPGGGYFSDFPRAKSEAGRTDLNRSPSDEEGAPGLFDRFRIT